MSDPASTARILIIGLDITQRKPAEAEMLGTLAREKELGQLPSNFVSAALLLKYAISREIGRAHV